MTPKEAIEKFYELQCQAEMLRMDIEKLEKEIDQVLTMYRVPFYSKNIISTDIPYETCN